MSLALNNWALIAYSASIFVIFRPSLLAKLSDSTEEFGQHLSEQSGMALYSLHISLFILAQI